MFIQKIIVAILTAILFGNVAEARPAPVHKARAKKQAVAKQPREPQVPYKAYIVVEANSGKMIEGENVDIRRPPASITKLMVACIVMEKLALGQVKLTDRVLISKKASNIGGSQVYLREGETFTLEELMKAMMIHSANDAAYAISEHVAGGIDQMVVLMNDKAKILGLKNTEFHSVHGLPPEKTQKEDLTTCQDLAVLSMELLRYPKVIEWSGTVTDTFRNGQFVLSNTNKLLTKLPGTDGLKTGFYDESGFNIAATAKKDGLRFIAVVMGSPTGKIRDSVAIEKLKNAFSHYRMLSILKKGEVIDKDVILIDGKYRKVKGIIEKDFVYPMLVDKKDEIVKEVVLPEKIKGEIRERQKLGEIVIKLENVQIGKVNIVSPVYVPKANLFTRFIRRLGLNI
ncbi:MAG TPA: D-alanyl-D-alanine carboxypeptidase family protein [Syntrophorhabdaceae bacterium]|nr:D-alanyl-D-alanine carboxypeptidase family protein [Syntrophorhabdaceae bacterium]